MKYDMIDYIIIGVVFILKLFVVVVSLPFFLPFYFIGKIAVKYNLDKFLDKGDEE